MEQDPDPSSESPSVAPAEQPEEQPPLEETSIEELLQDVEQVQIYRDMMSLCPSLRGLEPDILLRMEW